MITIELPCPSLSYCQRVFETTFGKVVHLAGGQAVGCPTFPDRNENTISHSLMTFGTWMGLIILWCLLGVISYQFLYY